MATDTTPINISCFQLSRKLKKPLPSKIANSNTVCLKMLLAHAIVLGKPLHHVFNMSICQGNVPALWRISCLDLIPENTQGTLTTSDLCL